MGLGRGIKMVLTVFVIKELTFTRVHACSQMHTYAHTYTHAHACTHMHTQAYI
jgi:hypothetical protein